MTESIERIYATALLDLADQDGQAESVSAQLNELGQLVESNDDLRRLLDSRILSAEDRTACVDRIFNGKINDLLYRFLLVVNSKERLAQLPGIAQAFIELVNERNNIADVEVWTAGELPPHESDALAQRLGDALNKTVKLNQHTDPAIIGGLRIRIGDQEVDGCVATQLQMMHQRFVSTGQEQSRANRDSLITD